MSPLLAERLSLGCTVQRQHTGRKPTLPRRPRNVAGPRKRDLWLL